MNRGGGDGYSDKRPSPRWLVVCRQIILGCSALGCNLHIIYLPTHPLSLKFHSALGYRGLVWWCGSPTCLCCNILYPNHCYLVLLGIIVSVWILRCHSVWIIEASDFRVAPILGDVSGSVSVWRWSETLWWRRCCVIVVWICKFGTNILLLQLTHGLYFR